MNKVKPKDCEAFDAYVRKWQTLLNLQEWRISRAPGRPRDVLADVTIYDEPRTASYRIGRDFGIDEVTPERLEETAIHELLHVFLHRLMVSQNPIVEHEVIHVLQKLLVKVNPQ